MRDRFATLGAPARLALFAVLLAVVGTGALGVGAVTRGDSGDAAHPPADSNAMAMGTAMTPASQAQANGLATTAGGFTFEPEQTRFTPGATAFRFRITDAQGRARHDFTREGGVRLHLIVVRRDLVGYVHVHPVIQADGSWLVQLNLATAGVYRAFADFEQHGEKTVLGADLFVTGELTPERMPAVSKTTTVDGYRVKLSAPQLHAGQDADLNFTVTRHGNPVPSFERYVGMRGHLVALHKGDLSYSHVHPLATNNPGQIGFRTELPSTGAYRMFLQFKHDGRVHTAPFTVKVDR